MSVNTAVVEPGQGDNVTQEKHAADVICRRKKTLDLLIFCDFLTDVERAEPHKSDVFTRGRTILPFLLPGPQMTIDEEKRLIPL